MIGWRRPSLYLYHPRPGAAEPYVHGSLRGAPTQLDYHYFAGHPSVRLVLS